MNNLFKAAWAAVQSILKKFTLRPHFDRMLNQAFGETSDHTAAAHHRQQFPSGDITDLQQIEVLKDALAAVQSILKNAASGPHFDRFLNQAFGEISDHIAAAHLRQHFQSGDFTDLPQIEVLSSSKFNGALGASYAASIDTIYLSQSLLQTAPFDRVVAILLEVIGRGIDARINPSDAPGVESFVFSTLVQGGTLSDRQVSVVQRMTVARWYSMVSR